MEKLKAKFIKLEIDGTMYEGFIQEVKGEAAAETATSQNFQNQLARDEQYWRNETSKSVIGSLNAP